MQISIDFEFNCDFNNYEIAIELEIAIEMATKIDVR